jgi:hypothetical protein
MALGDIVSKVLLEFKADTSQAKSEIRSLRGEERKASQDRLAELEQQNKGIESQIATLAKIAGVVGAGVAAFKLANDAAKAYLEDVRLASAAAGANVEKLQQATMGLVEQDKLLAFAGKSMHGTWKLNQEEMETVLKGATALRKTMGVELQPTIDALTESIAKGNTRALKEFGIEATDKAGVLRELSEAYKRVGGDASLAGDEWEKNKVTLVNAFDDIKGALGQLVIALTPLIEKLGQAAKFVSEDVFSPITNLDLAGAARAGQSKAWYDAHGAQFGQSMLEGWKDVAAFLKQHPEVLKAMQGPTLKKAGGGDSGRFELSFTEGHGFSGYDTLSQKMAAEKAAADAELSRKNWRHSGSAEFGGSGYDFSGGKSIEEQFKAQKEFQDRALGLMGGKKQTVFEQIFGTPEEISAHTAAIQAASGAIDIMSNAVGATYDAWLTGSESMSTAFKKSIAQSIGAIGKEMQIHAVKEAAMALASAAVFDWHGAAKHAGAAALFEAGAIAAGLASKAMMPSTGGGAGAASGGGGANAPRTIGSGPSGGDESMRPINVYVGAEWAAMSKIEQSAAIVRAIELGKRGTRHIRRA